VTDAAPKAGFVGAGRMGRPMVRRLLAAGHPVTVVELSEDARKALTEDGAEATADPRDLAGAQAVAVIVHTDAQVRQACLAGGVLDAMEPGSVLIVHTTCSPRTIDLLAEHAGPRGVAVVDAAISGGPQDIAEGRLTLWVGGDAEAVDRAEPFLAAYGDPVLRVGPRGNGQLVKLLNNAIFAANIGLLGQAASLAAGLGLDEGELLPALTHGSSASRALSGVAGAGSVAGFAAAVQEFLGKDLAVVREITDELGADLGALAEAHAVLAALLDPPR